MIRTLWRELTIVALASVIWLGHSIYYQPKVQNLELQVELEKAKTEQCQSNFEYQSNKILEQSKESKKIIEDRFSEIQEYFDKLDEQEQQDIEDIIDVNVPDASESCEELNDYLIEMTQRLRWETE